MNKLQLEEFEIINYSNIQNEIFSISTFTKVTIHCDQFQSGINQSFKKDNNLFTIIIKNQNPFGLNLNRKQIFNFNNNQNLINSIHLPICTYLWIVNENLTDFKNKFSNFNELNFKNVEWLEIENYFNISNSINNFSKLTCLRLINTNEIYIKNTNLIELYIYNNTNVIIQNKLNNLTYLYIKSNAKINENLNEVCENLKRIYFDDMTDKTINFTLSISITNLNYINSDNIIKINNLNKLTNINEMDRNKLKKKFRKI